MTPEQKHLADRVAKLLALANSTTFTAEAQLARSAAEQLLEAYAKTVNVMTEQDIERIERERIEREQECIERIERIEREEREYQDRLACGEGWDISTKGVPYINIGMFNITIFRWEAYWQYSILNFANRKEKHYSPMGYPDEGTAKRAAYADMLEMRKQLEAEDV